MEIGLEPKVNNIDVKPVGKKYMMQTRFVNKYSFNAYEAGKIDIRDLIFESVPSKEDYSSESNFARIIPIKIIIPDRGR